MGGSETPESGTEFNQPTTPERESQLPRSSSEKWNLGVLESGLDGEGELQEKPSGALWTYCATPTLPKKDEAVTYPEGGVRAWLVVFGSWCAILTALGTSNSFASFQSYFMTHQLSSYSPGVVGWIFSVRAFLAFAGGIVVGPIFDTYGPTWLIVTGSIGVCLAMFLLGICEQYWHFFLVFGLLGGGSSGLLYSPAIAAVGHYFRKKRGNALGIALSSGAIGGIIFPLMLEALIPKVGFAWSTRILGVVYACACVVACILIRSRLPPAKNSNAMPDLLILKDPAFATTVLAIYLLQWAFCVPLAYISSYALYHGFSSAFSYHVLVFLNVGSVFGRWLPGLTGDKIGHYNTTILITILTVVSVLGVWLPMGHTTAGFLVFAVSFGFTSGSIFTLTAACVGQLCQIEDYGRYFATSCAIASVGNLTGIPIGGELVVMDHGDYQSLIVFVGLCYASAVPALVVVRILQTGWKLRVVY